MTVAVKAPTPIQRIFDETKAREFYIDFLGFTLNWEHRFGENFPLYAEIARGECVLHLSEHHGDACPGAALRIEVDDIEAFHAELTGKDYRFAKPGCERTGWDTLEVRVTDPFGNRLTFFQPAP